MRKILFAFIFILSTFIACGQNTFRYIINANGGIAITAPLSIGGVTITSTGAEINILHGVPAAVTATKLGYLSNVTSDIQTQLNSKQATLVSGTNIKTVGGNSLLGAGDIAVVGTGTVTSVSVTTAAGVSGSVATATTTPAITVTLGAITPTSVAATGTVTGSNLSGTNTGDNATNTQYSGLVTNATHTGDVTGSGALTIATGAVTLAKMANMATGSLIYRKTALAGAPEVNSLATLKTDLGLVGSNTGDQTDISGNAGTATKLYTTKTINGVAFDGSANISVPSNIVAGTSGNLMTSNGSVWTSAAAPDLTLKLNVANPTATGTLTTPILRVGNAASNTLTSLDSISKVTGATDISFFDGPDTLNPYIPFAGRVGLESVAITTATPTLTATVEGNVIKFFKDGVEVHVMAYAPLYENTYYVKNGGDDTKSGLTDADAWAHHPWMTGWTGTTVLQPGDVVEMKRGNSWTITGASAPFIQVAQSGTLGKPITMGAYGTGAKPLIKINDDVNYPVIEGLAMSYVTFDNLEINHWDNVTFDASCTQSGIMFAVNDSTPHDWTITNCTFHDIPYAAVNGWDDSYNITIGNIHATTTATTTTFSNEIYDCNYAGIQLNGRDAVSNHSHFDVYYNYIHDIGTSTVGVNAYGVAFTSVSTSTGWPAYAIARFNRVEDIPAWEGIDCHGGTYIYAQDNYVYNCYVGIQMLAADRGGLEEAILENCYIERNTVEQPGNHPSAYYSFIVLDAENVLLRPTACYIRDNILFYTARPNSEASGRGILVHTVDGVTIDGNTIYNGPTGVTTYGAIYIGGAEALKCKNVTVQNNFILDWDCGIGFNAGVLDGALNFYSNIIYSHGVCVSVGSGTFAAAVSLLFYNNTIMTSSTASMSPMNITDIAILSAGTVLTLENNIIGFINENASGIYINGPTIGAGTFTSNYNNYWNSTRATPFYQDNAGHTFAQWQAHGEDANGLNASDPLFTNGGGTYHLAGDFALDTGSPCENTGMNTGITLDYYGLPRVGNFDIGAIEKQ